MDAMTVQKHVADYLNSASVTRFDHCYDAQPESFGANLYAFGAGTTRCIGFANCMDDTDIRRSGPAANPSAGQPRMGIREQEFMIQLEILHVTAEEDWREAERQLKQDVVEGIRNAILNDPTLGTSNMPRPLFNSAGEGKKGFKRTYAMADTDNEDGERRQWAMIVFSVCSFEVG